MLSFPGDFSYYVAAMNAPSKPSGFRCVYPAPATISSLACVLASSLRHGITLFAFGRPASLAAVIAVVLALPGLLYFALHVESNTQDVHTWLPGGISQRADYDRFIDLFGNDDDLIISWDGCTTDDPRLDQFSAQLDERHVGEEECFCKLATARDVIERLTSEPLGLSETEARERMSGVFFGPNGLTTGIIARLSATGRCNRNHCIDELYAEADKIDSLGRDALRIGGSSFVSVQIHNSTHRALYFSVPAGILAILVTFFSLRSIRLTTITLSVAGIAALISIAVVCCYGYKINGLLVLMPVIVMVLTLSGGIHMAGYYRHSLQSGHIDDAIRNTLRLGWRPCVLAMVTTSMGIMMLCTSHIEAVRHFGFFTAAGLIFALGTLLSMYPALLTLWPAAEKDTQRFIAAGASRIGSNAKHQVVRRPWIATVGVAAVLILTPVLLFGTSRLKTTLGPENMFHSQSVVHRNHSWLEENLLPIQCVEIVASFDNEQLPRMTSQIEQLQNIQNRLSQLPEVTSVFSFASLCEPIPQGKGLPGVSKRSLINTRIANEKPELVRQRLVAEKDGKTHWRIRLGLDIAEEERYEGLTGEIQRIANCEFGATAASDSENTAGPGAVASLAASNSTVSNSATVSPEIMVTGIWPLSAAGRQQLFEDLSTSFMLAFLMITPLIMLIVGGFYTGLIAMLPNVFPALLFFGLMGWAGFTVDIGTILTASVGLGIAVDDTLHFLETYMRTRKETGDRSTAVWETVMHCGKPMLHTSLICSAGLCVFAASQFIPARQFAIAICVLLGLALVSDLLLLPALILSPFGKLFERNHPKNGPIDEPSVEEEEPELRALAA